MQSRPTLTDDITVHHARLLGRGAGRGELELALAGLHASDVTDRDEILVIPHFRAQMPLSTAAPRALFAQRLTTQLSQLRRDALVDPSGFGKGNRILRFTSKSAFAFWVLAVWVRGGEEALVVSKTLEGERVAEWQRAHVLNDARLLVRVVGSLACAGLAARWTGQLTARDIATATPQLAKVYRVAETIWESPREQRVLAAPSQSPSTHFASPRRDAGYFPRGRIKNYASDAPAISIAPIIAAAGQSGNDLLSLEEPLRRFLTVALVLSTNPNIGPRLDRVDWKSVWQPVPVDPVRLGDMSETGNTRQAPAEVKPKAKSSEKRLPFATSDTARPVVKDVGQKVPEMAAETKSPTTEVVPLKAPQLMPKSSAFGPQAINFEADAPVEFSTGFGGLFFLINVFISLGLYPDFTRPMDNGLDVSPFRLLDRLALRMFGARYRSDPLHGWLGAVGRGGALPDKWSVNEQWLEDVGRPQRIDRQHSRGHLTYWDARGFALLDMPLRDVASRAGRRWQWRSRSGGPIAGALRRLPTQASDRWVSCLAGFIEFRLGLAASGLSSALLRMPAQVRVRDDAVSVHFALASLPMAVRIAGLDRNPGWLPAEGRDLTLEFV